VCYNDFAARPVDCGGLGEDQEPQDGNSACLRPWGERVEFNEGSRCWTARSDPGAPKSNGRPLSSIEALVADNYS